MHDKERHKEIKGEEERGKEVNMKAIEGSDFEARISKLEEFAKAQK